MCTVVMPVLRYKNFGHKYGCHCYTMYNVLGLWDFVAEFYC